MKKNMGIVDRIIRVLTAVVIGFLYFNGTISGTTAIVLLVISVIFLATSLISRCPLYIPFGIKTHKSDTSAE